MEITAIEPRRRNLCALFLDGEAVLIDSETLSKSRLQLGDTLTDEQLAALVAASNARRAQEKALYLLARREHAYAELTRKLTTAAGPEAARAAADRMVELGLVDDKRFARQYARELIERRRFTSRRVAYELARRGIDRDLIDQVLEEMAPDPTQQLIALLHARYNPPPADEKGQRRMIAALSRMGYAYADIRSVLRQIDEDVEFFNTEDD